MTTRTLKLCVAFSVATCVLTACFCVAGTLAAIAPPAYEFEHLTVDDGLPENSVRAMVQDTLGFLWIGTHSGLARFDGRKIVDRWHAADDSIAVPRFMVLALSEDEQGRLWIGTALRGLWLMDPRTERFRQLDCSLSGRSDDRGPDLQVTDLCAGPDGSMWVGWSRDGVCRHDAQGDCLGYLDGLRAASASAIGECNAVVEDADANLWVGTSRAGVFVRDSKTGHWKNYSHDENDAQSLIADQVNDIYEGPDGQIWFSTVHGLSGYLPREKRFRNFRPGTEHSGERDEYLLQIDAADGGGLWIGSAIGLYHFDTVTGRFDLYAHDPDDPASPVKGPVLSVLRDRSGVVWGGSWHAGLNKLDPGRAKFVVSRHRAESAQSLDDDAVAAIFEDSRGDLWVGTGTTSAGVTRGGLNRRRRGRIEFEHVELPPHVQSVRAVAEDPAGNIWFGTESGLFVFDVAADGVRDPFPEGLDDQELGSVPIYDLEVDRSGNLWATTTGYGLYRLDTVRRDVRRYSHSPDDPNSISQDRLVFTLIDSRGRVWIGADTQGLNLYRPLTDDFQRFIDLDAGLSSLTDMIEDREGRLWVASWAGLLEFDPDHGIVRSFHSGHGLPHDLVASILEGALGRLWLSTGRGVVRLDPQTGEARVFDTRDGLPSNAGCFGHAQGRDGRMYFGGQQGLISFHPDEIRDSRFVPRVVLAEIRFADQPQAPGATSPLALAPAYTGDLRVTHSQNDLGFDFAALDFVHPDRIQYRYRLSGYDDDWRGPTSVASATYTNLHPGTYRLEVEATNSDGVWTGAKTSMALAILPPWWQTIWARAMYGLLAIAIGYAIYAQVVHRERMRAALRIQSSQAQHLKELDDFKSRFFANISHEFRTPLTLLQSPLQKLKDDPTSGDRILFAMMQRNAARLRELIDQLLDLARLEAGRLPLRWTKGDWSVFLRSLVYSFHSLAAGRGVELACDLPESAKPTWHDPDVMEKIVSNLLANAFRFTPDGGTVHARASVEQENRCAPVTTAGPTTNKERLDAVAASWLVFEVFNSGSYISPEDQQRIFGRFEQTTSDRAGHSGLGLALVRELVEWMHGSIEVESELDEGTTFRVYLPLYDEPPIPGLDVTIAELSEATRGVSNDPENASAESEASSTGEERPLVLVVEDHPDLRQYLGMGLADEFRVVEAADGETGIALAFEEVPDLVISDVMMPGMDGFELTRKIKEDERTSHVPVILLTARVETESRREGLQSGADDYLAKPFDIEELRIRVTNLIDQRRRLAERFAQRVIEVSPDKHPVVSANDKFLARAYRVIEEHLDDSDLDVETLCREIGMSRAQLHRKLKALTGQSTREFLRTYRLRRAATLIEGGFGNVTEIAFAVGFSSSSYFAQCFREQYGASPTEYAAKSSTGTA